MFAAVKLVSVVCAVVIVVVLLWSFLSKSK